MCHIPLNPSVKENPGAKKPLPRLPAQGHRGSPNHRSPPQSPEDHCCSNHEASASHNTRTSRNSMEQWDNSSTNNKETVLSRKVMNEFKLFWTWEIWKMMKSADVKIL